jgi:hypothetical protein
LATLLCETVNSLRLPKTSCVACHFLPGNGIKSRAKKKRNYWHCMAPGCFFTPLHFASYCHSSSCQKHILHLCSLLFWLEFGMNQPLFVTFPTSKETIFKLTWGR